MAAITNFWNYKTILDWQAYLLSLNLVKDCYIDNNNILRVRRGASLPLAPLRDKNKQGQGLAYVGGDMKKVDIGVKITNKLRTKTSSFQYVYGATSPLIREDGIEVSGPIVELIAEPNLEEWIQTTPINAKSQAQVYSIIIQLCYAAYLLSFKSGSVEKAMTGIKIRQVDEKATIPFFDGNIKTYGVVPVITDLANIQTDVDEVNIISYLLDVVISSPFSKLDWSRLQNNYAGINIRNGYEWNDILGIDIFSQKGEPTLSCADHLCLSTFTSSNGKSTLELDLIKATELPLLDYIRPFASAFSALINNEESPFTETYLNPELIQETLDDLERDRLYLEKVKEDKYRKVVFPDLKSSSTTNEYFIREEGGGLRRVRKDHLAIIKGEINYINHEEESFLQPLDQDDVYVRNIGNIPRLVNNSCYLLELGLRYLDY